MRGIARELKDGTVRRITCPFNIKMTKDSVYRDNPWTSKRVASPILPSFFICGYLSFCLFLSLIDAAAALENRFFFSNEEVKAGGLREAGDDTHVQRKKGGV